MGQEWGPYPTPWLGRSSHRSTRLLVPVLYRVSGQALFEVIVETSLVFRYITVFIFIKAIPSMITFIGIHGIFFVHGCVLIFAVFFAWIFVPETKGKTLTELCALYEK